MFKRNPYRRGQFKELIAVGGAGALMGSVWLLMLILALLFKAGILVALIWLVWKGLQLVGILS